MAKINLFRVTIETDIQTTVDRIDFNIPGIKTDVENAFITQLSSLPTDGVGNNQGASTPNGDQSALGTIEDVLIIDGFISKRNGNSGNGQNAFLAKLKLWETEPKEVDAVWELGRMGIVVDDNHNADLIPIRTGTSQKAYLWERIEYKSDFKGNREFFKLYLRVNRGDGT